MPPLTPDGRTVPKPPVKRKPPPKRPPPRKPAGAPGVPRRPPPKKKAPAKRPAAKRPPLRKPPGAPGAPPKKRTPPKKQPVVATKKPAGAPGAPVKKRTPQKRTPLRKPAGAPGTPHAPTVKKQRYEKAKGTAIRVDGKLGPRTQYVYQWRLQAKNRQLPEGMDMSVKHADDIEARIRASARNNHRAYWIPPEVAAEEQKIRQQIAVKEMTKQELKQRKNRGVRDQAFLTSGMESFGRHLLTPRNIRTNPAIRDYATPRIMVAYFYDPFNGVWRDAHKNPQKILKDTNNTKLLQEWLRQRGHKKDVNANGSWAGKNGEATVKAMKAESREIQRVEKHRNIVAVTKAYFDTGVMSTKKGIRLPGSPLGAPTRHFTPKTLYNFLAIDTGQARELARYLSTVASWQISDRAEAYAEAYLQQSVAFAGTRGGTTGARYGADPRTGLVSWKMDEFLKKEKPESFFGMLLAGAGDLLEATMKPAEWVEQGALGAWMMIKDPLNPDNFVFWGEAEKRRNDRAKAILDEFHAEHPWLDLGVDVIADPLNFVGIGLLSKVARIGLNPARLGALNKQVALAGEHGRYPWKLQEISRRDFKNLTEATMFERWASQKWDNVAEAWIVHPVAGRAVQMVRHATALKIDLEQRAHREIQGALGRLGKPVRLTGPKGQTAGKGRFVLPDATKHGRDYKIPKKIGDAMENAARNVAPDVLHAGAELVNFAVKGRWSIYGDVRMTPGELSEFGHHVEGAMMTQIDGGAIDDASRVWADQILANWEKLVGNRMSEAGKSRVWEMSYKDARSQFVAPWGPSSVEMLDIFEPILARRQEHWRTVGRRELQMQIEEKAGINEIFEAGTGLPKKRGSQELADMRSAVREIYDEANWIDMVNPNYGKVVSESLMKRLRGNEKRFHGGRIAMRARVLRGAREGIDEGADLAEQKLWDKELRRINGAWRPVEGGFTDIRKTIKVPPQYLKHLMAAKTPGSLDSLVARMAQLLRLDHNLSWKAIKADSGVFTLLFEKSAIRLGYANEPWFKEMLNLMTASIETAGRRRFVPGHFVETGSFKFRAGTAVPDESFLKRPEWRVSEQVPAGPWRDKGPTDLQRNVFRNQGREMPPGMTRGEAADVINGLMEGWSKAAKVKAVREPRPKEWIPESTTINPGAWQVLWRNLLRKPGVVKSSAREDDLVHVLPSGDRVVFSQKSFREAARDAGFEGKVPTVEFKVDKVQTAQRVSPVDGEYQHSRNVIVISTREEVFEQHTMDVLEREVLVTAFHELKHADQTLKVGLPKFEAQYRLAKKPLEDEAESFGLEQSKKFLGRGVFGASIRGLAGPPHPHLDEFKEIIAGMTGEQFEFAGRSNAMTSSLKNAEPFMKAKFMMDNGGYFQALRWAQAKPARVAYLGLNGLMGSWRFLALPLKPGWMVVNTIDNTVKTLLAGTVDPRAWFYPLGIAAASKLGKQAPRSAFEMGLREMFEAGRFLAKLNGHEDDFVRLMGGIYDQVWATPAHKLAKVFAMHDILTGPVSIKSIRAADLLVDKGIRAPQMPTALKETDFSQEGDKILARYHATNKGKVIPGARLSKFSEEERAALIRDGVDPTFVEKNQARLAAIHDGIWDLFGNRTENWAKRTIYRDEYIKSMKLGTTEEQAMVNAWAKIEKTLFDYSKITVIEDNLRIFFPFIQYWRKNTVFWAQQVADKPFFLTHTLDKYQDALAVQNEDLPDWQKRYLSLKPVGDVISRVPGLQWLGDLVEEAWFDPLNAFSFKALYSAFKSANPNLTPEQAGWQFLNGFIQGMEDFGATLNPFIRKPLEMAGALDLRSWQDIFPQTRLGQAFTRDWLQETFPNGLNVENWLGDKILQALGKDISQQGMEAATWLKAVQGEMAAQAARGEPIDREKAEKKINDFLFVQALTAYFVGTYIRKMSPEDIYYAKLAEEMRLGQTDFLNLSPEERALYRLYQKRGMDAVTFDYYTEQIPKIREYYSVSWLEGQDILEAHPELRPFVEEKYGRRNGSEPGWVQQTVLNQETKGTLELYDLITKADLPYKVNQAAWNGLVTPDLAKYWKANDTPLDAQIKMLRGQLHRQIAQVMKEYHAMPDGPNGWKHKQEFLAHHPELVRFWQDTAGGSGDLTTIYRSTADALRQRYFEFLNKRGDPDFDGAINFLQKHPWIFDPLPGYRAKYRQIAKVGHYPGYTPYSKGKYGYGYGSRSHGLSTHAKDYLNARSALNHFFALMEKSKDRAYDWLNGNSAAAKKVRAYFDKYSHNAGQPKSQHARDYLKAKNALDRFFKMLKNNKDAAYRWLRGKSAQAKQVRKYLDKYGKGTGGKLKSQHARDFKKAEKWLKLYFRLMKTDKEAAFAYLRSNKPGAKILREYFAKYVKEHDTSEHKEAYDKIKDVLTAYFDLPENQRQAYLAKHPELKAYFDKYAEEGGQSQHSLDYAALAPVIKGYFALPVGQERRAYLDAHPELRDYFAKYAQPNNVAKGFSPNSRTDYIRRRELRARLRHRSFTTRRGTTVRITIPEEIVLTENPELRKRLEFWHIYYNLPPDERVAFITDHADEYGIFIYGFNSDQHVADNISEWMRKAFSLGVDSERSARYAYVKPLLDFYYDLSFNDREIFRRANPELDDYLNEFTDRPSSGDAALDALIQRYFELPGGSRDRSVLLDTEPSLKAFLEENNSQEDTAIHTSLETYFGLTSSAEKKEYLLRNPELAAYFEKRREEKKLEKAMMEAFDQADPRLDEFFGEAQFEIFHAAYLRQKRALIGTARDLVLEDRERKGRKPVQSLAYA